MTGIDFTLRLPMQDDHHYTLRCDLRALVSKLVPDNVAVFEDYTRLRGLRAEEYYACSWTRIYSEGLVR
jgi:hypothetical protein